MAAENPIIAAVFSRLTGYSALTALLANGSSSIFDFLPQELADTDSEFPYIFLGNLSAQEFDADDRLGTDATLVVHTFSRYRGRKEAADIMAQVYNALHRYDDLTVSGYNTVDVQWAGLTQVMTDPDGLTQHGVQSFRVVVTKAA